MSPFQSDTYGLFGPAGGNIGGDTFSASISYNPADFTYSAPNYYSTTPGAMTTRITINGKTQTIVTVAEAIGEFVSNPNGVDLQNVGASPIYPEIDVNYTSVQPPTLTNPSVPAGGSDVEFTFSGIPAIGDSEILVATTSSLIVVSPFLLAPASQLGDIDLQTLIPEQSNLAADAATGLAVDGASAAIVLYQVNSNAAVTFTTDNGTTLLPYDDNAFLTHAPTQGKASVTVTPQPIGSSYFAAALLQTPPPNFVPDFSIPTIVSAQQVGGGQQGVQLPLVPPPVVLVHGIWGSAKSLASVKSYLTSMPPWQTQSGLVVPIQYKNDIKFDDPEPSQALGAEVHNILNAAIAQGIVVGRIDLIAHSMGGLVARHYSSLPDYKAIYDRTEGRFHNIITLDTPETGSLLASYLFTHAGDWYGLNGADSSASDDRPPSHTWPWIVWHKACGDVLHSTTVEVCFAGEKINSPLAPAGQLLTDGAVYSLIPGGKSLSNLPPANIPNALWLAVSALRPPSDGYSGESALQFELESLIAATYKDQKTAKNISSILMDEGQDDVIVPLTSQTAGALPNQYATVDDLAHSPPSDPPWLVKYGLGLSLANVENSSTVNALIACWLETEGASSCIVPNAQANTASTNQAATLLPGQTKVDAANRLSVHMPTRIRLAEPFELAVRTSTSRPTYLSATQVDKFGHSVERELEITRIANGFTYASVVPVFYGPVTFTINARFEDGAYSSKDFRKVVGLPLARAIAFHADFNNWQTFYLSLTEGGDVGELHPEAVFASAPGQKIPLDGWVKFALTPAADKSIIELSENGTFRALREGATTVEARFGNAITRVNVIVEDTRAR
jgi:pimeloyl-ACP methyl ester carboxylesterase